MHKVEPAGLEFDAGGHPYSRRYGDVYASRDGALGQARHVFLGGNDLPPRWARREQFVVLETGFGLGINFLAAWQAWRDDPARPARLHFVSVERHPLAAADLLRAAPEPLRVLAAQLAEQWPLPLPGLHRLGFEGERVVLTLALGEAAAVVPQLVLGADAFFLDGFAPDRNPDMWSPPLVKALARLARPGATLATWCTARSVRDALEVCGFAVERRAGYGHKREMQLMPASGVPWSSAPAWPAVPPHRRWRGAAGRSTWSRRAAGRRAAPRRCRGACCIRRSRPTTTCWRA
jgi:tRNA 5-methylaminomethyl-2-thiouridine biosynthesis bifunctional protein